MVLSWISDVGYRARFPSIGAKLMEVMKDAQG